MGSEVLVNYREKPETVKEEEKLGLSEMGLAVRKRGATSYIQPLRG